MGQNRYPNWEPGQMESWTTACGPLPGGLILTHTDGPVFILACSPLPRRHLRNYAALPGESDAAAHFGASSVAKPGGCDREGAASKGRHFGRFGHKSDRTKVNTESRLVKGGKWS